MKKKMIISIAMALLLVLCMFPSISLAGSYTISKSGAYTMSVLGYASGDTVTIGSGLTVTLIGDSTVTYTNFAISCGAGVTLTISNVNIDDSANNGVCPLSFTGSGNTLNLADGTVSTLKGGVGCAGVSVGGGTTLTLAGDGTLNAYGQGFNGETEHYGGAGIGGNGTYSGSITIAGGTINATGGFQGAGIGSGSDYNSPSYTHATVTITGGTVNATGGQYGAGIGGGLEEDATVVITGGTVNATGGNKGAGIGGGGNGTVTITGGTVSASGDFGAGIGGGCNGDGTVNISGGVVHANATITGAAIGGGQNKGGTVNISGGTITAMGSNYSVGIGRGYNGTSTTINISGGTVFAGCGTRATQDIDPGPSGTANVTGTASVFLREDAIANLATTTHAHYNYGAGTATVYGISMPSDWTGAFGAYLRVCTLNYDANGGSGAPSAVSQLYGTTASVASGSGVTNGNWNFAGWNTKMNGGGTSYNSGDTYTFTGADTLYAQWGGTNVTVSSSNDSYGSVSGGGKYEPGTDVTVTAAPNSGYYFVGWYNGDTLVSSSASYKFTAGDDISLTAQFKAYITINAVSGNSAYGSVSGGGNFTADASVTLTAAANTGYYFTGWYNGDTLVSSSAAYNFSASESVTLTAKFGSYFTVTAVSGNAAYGSAVGGGAVIPGSDVTVTATAKSGYYFAGWYQGGVLVSASPSYTFTPVSDAALTAQFDVVGIPDTITASAVYNKITVSWSAAGGAKGYGVYRSTAENGTYTLIATTTSTSYSNTGLNAGTTYYYKVRGYKLSGNTKVYGNYYSAIVSATTALGQVTGVKVTLSDPKSAKITWNEVSGASKYEVWRGETEDGVYTFVTETSSLGFTNTGLTTDYIYYYKVIAYRTVNGSKVYGGFSDPLTVTPTVAEVTGVKAARTSTSQVKISWSAVNGATKYEIWVSDRQGGTYTLLGETTATSYVDKTGAACYYKVRAYNLIITDKHYGGYSSVVSP